MDGGQFVTRVKKPIYVSAAEKEANRRIREAARDAYPPRTVKMECTYSKGGAPYVETGWYVDEEAFRNHSERMLKELRKLSPKWKIVQAVCVARRDGSSEEE